MLPQQVNIRSEASTSGMVQQVSQIFASLEFVEAKLALEQEFSKKDLGQLHHFLGISVQYQPISQFLSQ
jgi:hypothetical protein